jgi:acyl-CoA synthetase (AMP-forming)/AMP-acid ligase II
MNIWRFLKEKLHTYEDKPALVYGKHWVSYARLIFLIEKSAPTSRERVCVCDQENKLKQAIAILRCFSNNQVCVPISPEYGEMYVSRIKNELKEQVDHIAAKSAGILFTSGSTGKPKGVMLSHENIVSNIRSISNYFAISENDAILIARPLMHAAVLTGELLVSLYKGLTVHLYEEAFQPQRILSYINQNDITVFCATPTVFSFLIRYVKEPVGLRSIAISGECLSGELANKISNTFPDAEKYSVYGLTEASPRVSYLPPALFTDKSGSIGIAIDDAEMKLIDQNGTDICGEGEGRLLVKSPGVMLGYLGNPSLTSKKIRNGWLYTGDIAYRDKDGYYYIKGRTDNMIIRSGMNIYPEEIETIIKQDSRITEAVCYPKYGKLIGQMLCLKAVGEITLPELNGLIKEKLPLFMHPNEIEIVKDIEKTVSGKLIRQ